MQTAVRAAGIGGAAVTIVTRGERTFADARVAVAGHARVGARRVVWPIAGGTLAALGVELRFDAVAGRDTLGHRDTLDGHRHLQHAHVKSRGRHAH